MRFSKIAALSSVILFLCSSIFSCTTLAAENDPESRVLGVFTITYETGTQLMVDITMDVQQITTDRTYTKEDIKNIQDQQELGALRYAVFLLLKDQIKNIFLNATLQNFAMPVYKNEHFNEVLNVTLPPEFFQLSRSINSSEFINGVLDMNAIVSYVYDFYAEAGWNNTYIIVLPESLQFRNTTGRVNGNRIQWDLDNWNGRHSSKRAYLSLQSVHPTTPTMHTENITLAFGLDAARVQKTDFKTTINIESINISTYSTLPTTIMNLATPPADGVRLLIHYGFFTWDDLYQQTLQKIEHAIVSTLETSSFNQSLALVFSWNTETAQNCTTPYTITHMNTTPAITATWTDTDVNLRILNLTAKAMFGLITAGAQAELIRTDINFGTNLGKIGYPYTCILSLPAHVFINNKNPYTWNQSATFSGAMNSDISPTYAEEQKRMKVTIEITKMDLNIPSFITGKSELTAPATLKEDEDIYVTTLPSEFTLPDKMYIDYLNADAFRLCVDEQVFTDEEITAFLANQKQDFEQRMSTIFNGQSIAGFSDRKMFNTSLQWDGDIAKMDANAPVTVSSTANSLHTVPFNISVVPPSFSFFTQQFTLKGLDDREVTYRLIFPNGVSVSATDALGKTIVTGETEKGQQYIEIYFEKQEALEGDVISCTLTASSIFVLALFFPCILSLILVVILVLVIYIINKKRRSRGMPRSRRRRTEKEAVEEQDEAQDQEEPDFYVPPPPPSSRRKR
ncbi:MAG: hypothetical protein V1726_06940 [Methanobacteriota archaeon]